MTEPRRSEAGIALPVAIMVLALALLLTGLLLLASTRSSKASDADRSDKRALQAADAGLDVARSQVNRLNPSTAQCVAVNAAANGSAPAGSIYLTTPTAAPYCPAVGGTLADGTTYSYQLSMGATPRTVISTGATTSGVTQSRRVAATLTTSPGTVPLFGVYGVSSNQDLFFSNGSTLNTDSRSNGNINAQLNLCGTTATPGPGKATTFPNGGTWCGTANPNPSQAAFTPATSAFTYSPVDLSAVKANNNNSTACASGKCGSDPSKPTIDIGDNGSYTIPTGDYYFCRVTLTGGGGRLIIPSGARVRIYLAPPSDCAGVTLPSYSITNGSSTTTGGYQFQKANGYVIDNQGKDAGALQIYAAGSASSTQDGIYLGQASSDDYLTIYAPNSTVRLDNNPRLYGAVAADLLSISGGGFVTATTASKALTGAGGSSTSASGNYRECVTDVSATGGCAAG